MLLLLACLGLCWSSVANAQTTMTLQTAQTLLKLEAGREAPRLVSLRNGANGIWTNNTPERLVDSVEQGGQKLALHWVFSASHANSHIVTATYENASPRLRLTWQWQARADIGPIEHTITIENLSGAELWLPLQPSFDYRFQAEAGEPLQQSYVEKGAGKPTDVGTHVVVVPTGYDWKGRSSTYARDEDEREIIPWFAVMRQNAAQDGWYAGLEFSGRTQFTLARDAQSIYGGVGLNPDPGPFRTRLAPQETFTTPCVFVGAFTGGMDGLGNVLRPWVRQVLNNPITWRAPAYPPLVNNSWGSGMQIDEGLAQRMMRDSAELGLEMFHIDAGWFRGVGDWYPDPVKFPHGFGPIVEEAHRRGLKLGLWVDWAQAGVDANPGALNANDPKIRDWLVADVPKDWKPKEFVGRTTDLGFPPAREYARREVNRIITDYHLDMLEHDGYLVAKNCARSDHPHAAAPIMSTVQGSGVNMPDVVNSTDVSYHAVRAYYDIYAGARRAHPGLLFEVCNDGGRMVDFGSAAHGDYFSITDSYDPLSNRRAFYDASHLLPPPMLEDYVEKWPTPRIENFRYMLRSGMMGMLTIMQDTNVWTPQEHTAAKAEFALYKQKLRPLIRDADLYHVSSRPDGVHWDGIEYFDPRLATGVVYAFRGLTVDETQHTFLLQGVVPGHTYRLHFADHSSPDRSMTGNELLGHGLTVSLPVPLSSELIFFEETASRRGEP
jgi:hypothetical protein